MEHIYKRVKANNTVCYVVSVSKREQLTKKCTLIHI